MGSMAADRSYIADNDRERQRLEALVGRLDDAALGRGLSAGWTVGAVLGHLAFWDQRIVVLADLLVRGASVPVENATDVDWINDAAKPTQLALPPRVAATLALDAARAADRAVASLTDEQIARNAAIGGPINLRRAQHRREHLDEIDKALGRT
jgi:DinB family protein